MHTTLTAPRPLSDFILATAMSRGVVTAGGSTPLPEIATAMIAHEVHAIAIAHEPELRAVTAFALMRALVRDERDAVAADVAQPLPVMRSTDTVQQAVELMAAYDVSHVAVADPGAEAPAGMFSSFNVAAVIAGRDPRVVRLPVPAPARPMLSVSRLESLRVADIMHRGVVTCAPATALPHVAAILVDHRVHCVVVVGLEPGKAAERLVWSVLSDADLVAGARSSRLNAPASALAATEPLAVEEDKPLQEAVGHMVEHELTHLIAVDRTGMPSGVVSTLDVAHIFAARS
jgi:CBS domain-containing protein